MHIPDNMQVKFYLLCTFCFFTVFASSGLSQEQRQLPGNPAAYHRIMVESINQAFVSEVRQLGGDRHELRPGIEFLRQYHAGALSYCGALSVSLTEVDPAGRSELYDRAFARFEAGEVQDALFLLSDGELESALREAYRQDLQPDDPGFQQPVNNYLLKARLSVLQLRMEAASEYYMKAIHTDRLNDKTMLEYARFLLKLGDGGRALSFCERARELAQTDLQRGLAQDLLASIYAHTGEYGRAADTYDQARSLLGSGDSKLSEVYHIDYAISLRQQAIRHARNNSPAKAQNLFTRALDLSKDLSTAFPLLYQRETAETHIQFGLSYELQGAYESALDHYREGLRIYERLAAGAADVYELNFGLAQAKIAETEMRLNHSQEAEAGYLTAFKTISAISGRLGNPYHPEMGEVLNSLASLYIDQYRLVEAERNLREAQMLLQPLAVKYPASYEPRLANTFHLRGRIQQVNYDFEQAIHFYEQALDIRSHFARHDSTPFLLDLAESLADIGSLYVANSQFEQGLLKMHEAIELYKELPGEMPAAYKSRLANLLRRLGGSYACTHRYDSAREALLSSQQILMAAHPVADAAELAACRRELGQLYRVFGDQGAAQAAFEQAMGLLKELAVRDSARYKTEMNRLMLEMGALYLGKGDSEAAYAQVYPAVQQLELWVLDHPRSHLPLLARARRQLAEVWVEQGRIERAQELLEETLALQEGLADVRPDVHARELARCCYVMGQAYQKENEYRSAIQYYIRSLDILEQLEARFGEWVLADMIRVRHALGNAYREHGAFDMATQQYRKASQANQKLALLAPGAYDVARARMSFDRGQLLLAQKRYDEAFDMYQEAAGMQRVLATQYPGYHRSELAYTLGYMAWCKVFSRSFDEAAGYMQEAVSLDNAQVWLHLKQAPISLLSGAFQDARSIYVEYADSMPEAREVFLADLTLLEQSGLDHPDIRKARKLLEK